VFDGKSFEELRAAGQQRQERQQAIQDESEAARAQLNPTQLAHAQLLGLTPLQYLSRKKEGTNDGD
jgi:hypothetical protein